MSEEEGKKILNKLIDLGDWSDESENCGLPQLLHTGACTWQNFAQAQEECLVLKDFRNKMKTLVALMKRFRDTETTETMWRKGFRM